MALKPKSEHTFQINCIKGVQYQGYTETIVPYRVRKIARKATVTLWMERVWVVTTDTKDQSVKTVS